MAHGVLCTRSYCETTAFYHRIIIVNALFFELLFHVTINIIAVVVVVCCYRAFLV